MNKIYLDSAATTLPEQCVIEDIKRSLVEDWRNPSSIYDGGRKVRDKIEHAREQVRKFINAREKDKIIFTSNSTEANNLAIQGFMNGNEDSTLITDMVTHPSVFNVSDLYYFGNDANCIYYKVDHFGRIDFYDMKYIIHVLQDSKRKNIITATTLVNNETGVVNNIKELSEFVHDYWGYVLVDAAQCVYHYPIDVQKEKIDMMTFTSEKMGCPRGVGVLYVRDGINIEPIMYGGHQENGYRPGTENQAMIIALGNQCERLSDKQLLKDRCVKEMFLRNHLLSTIYAACDEICEVTWNYNPSLNSVRCNNIIVANNILSIKFKGYDNQQLLTLLDENGVECSAGSACSSGEAKPSRVLLNTRMSDEEANSTLRFSFDYRLTEGEIDEFGKILRKCLIALKED